MTQVSNDKAVIELAKMIRAYENSSTDNSRWDVTWNECVFKAIKRLGLETEDVVPVIWLAIWEPA